MNRKLLQQFALIGSFVLLLSACSPEKQPAEKRLVLVTRVQGAGDQQQIFSGEVRARQEVNLSFRVPGKIANRYVDSGARVKAGQVLARLDDQDLNLQSQAASASVQALKADRDLAQSDLIRYRSLVSQQLVSKSLYDSKVAQANAANARYQQALAQAKVNANQTSYAVILAPSAGVISQRLLEAGQVVSAGQPVFTFAADGAREVAISVAEKQVSSIHIGQDVLVELWTLEGTRYPAKIREIASAADNLTRTFAVRVAFDEASVPTQLGQSARIYIVNAQATTLSVPLSALYEDGDKAAVWVVDPKDGRIHKRAVNVLRYGAQTAEVSQGLRQEDWVVQAGVHLLSEGELVQAVDVQNRPVRFAQAAAKSP